MPNTREDKIKLIHEFATKHAGHKVRIWDNNGDRGRLDGAVGRVVGYSTENYSIAVEVLDGEGYWPIRRGSGVLVVDIASIVGAGTWRKIDELELIDVPKTNPSPYNSQCKICGSKCRQMGSYSMCSNIKCKSNKKMRAELKRPKTHNHDPNRIICRTCGNYALEYLSYNGYAGLFRCAKCEEKSEYELANGMLLARYSNWGSGVEVIECVCYERCLFRIVGE